MRCVLLTHSAATSQRRLFSTVFDLWNYSQPTGVVRPTQAGRAAYGPPSPPASIQKIVSARRPPSRAHQHATVRDLVRARAHSPHPITSKSCSRGGRTAIPQQFPQQFRSSSAAVPKQLRSSSAAAPQLLCITSAAALQLFFITSAVVPQHLRSSGTPPQGAFFLPSPVEKEKPTTARGRHGQFPASIGIGGCRREARALSVVPPSRRPLRSNNRRQQRRRMRRSCFFCARRGGGGSFLGFRNS